MLRKFIIILCLCFSCCGLYASMPQITSKDVVEKMNTILKEHVLYQELTPELIERIFINYLEDLDPHKSYFIEGEIYKYLKPSQEMLLNTLKTIKKGNFAEFQKIHSLMDKAIKRHNLLLEGEPLVGKCEAVAKLKKDKIEWIKSEQELRRRLFDFRACQLETASKYISEDKDVFLKRLDKYRINRENKLLGKNGNDREVVILTMFLKAFCSALDTHTTYFTPSEAEQFMVDVEQRIFGIGALLKDDLTGLSIVRIIEGSPAAKSDKLKINDKIIAVNKESVIGLDITDAVEKIRGEKGTPVLLTIVREGKEDKKTEKLEVEIVRGEVVLEESRLESSFEPFGKGVIAFLHLSSFYQDPTSSSGQDIRRVILKLKKEHDVQGVILDLRNNAGGLLPQAVAVAGQFIKRGVVVSVKDNSDAIRHLRNTEDDPIWEGPLIVLINRASASASEIVAQALKDYGRAVIVGDDHSFGKGSFQTFSLDVTKHKVQINPQGEYKVTRGLYYTVSGKSPQLTGVISDIEIPGVFSTLDVGEKFAKYPLPSQSIAPSFEDNLDDLPLEHREKVASFYKHNLQEQQHDIEPYLAILKANSQKRIELNKIYQKFLSELKAQNFTAEEIVLFQKNDLQLAEAYNVMKDFVLLSSYSQLKEAASY